MTAFHVVDGCTANELRARSSMGGEVTFRNMVGDKDRDLAILKANEPVEGGLDLETGHSDPSPEAVVKTWGYPLAYNDGAPILSRGYVAGYSTNHSAAGETRHIIINGAFNPGNSGGPLILEKDGAVVGVVVSKWTLFSPLAEAIINGLQNHVGGVMIAGGTVTLPDGTKFGGSQEQMIAKVLQEFYDETQVMIGEAVSVSELKAFLHEKERTL